MQITRTGTVSQQGPAEHFTGTVRLEQVAAPEPPSRLRMFNVHFAPGAHTAWHTHPRGQVLHVLAGEGRVQREGGPVEVIRPGDSVWIEPDERHWHGAGPRTSMTHLATVEAAEDGTTVCWGEHVGPAAYPDA
ncbi:cupin domain-containing protein [Streptomyces sp. NPDC059524]|uniref:(R)-mandelonitrile lyase n=1 Tax=Streptomyces sp. NPDC059524 TaxID=3346856 RepID=UPI003692D568